MRPEAEKIREEAMKRIADKPSLVLDGDPIEELALAHERHAERLRDIARSLHNVGKTNHLGDTVEGRAATRNIVIAVHEDEGSVVQTLYRQADEALKIASLLRSNDRSIRATDVENSLGIEGVGRR